jgi:hypothetical protein
VSALNLIKNEIRLPLSGIFFICIGVPFIFKDDLGIFTTICFALASLCLFCVFAIMPHTFKQKLINIENQYHRIYRSIVQDKKKQAYAEYLRDVKNWIGVAVFLLVLGIIGYAVLNWF